MTRQNHCWFWTLKRIAQDKSFVWPAKKLVAEFFNRQSDTLFLSMKEIFEQVDKYLEI